MWITLYQFLFRCAQKWQKIFFALIKRNFGPSRKVLKWCPCFYDLLKIAFELWKNQRNIWFFSIQYKITKNLKSEIQGHSGPCSSNLETSCGTYFPSYCTCTHKHKKKHLKKNNNIDNFCHISVAFFQIRSKKYFS